MLLPAVVQDQDHDIPARTVPALTRCPGASQSLAPALSKHRSCNQGVKAVLYLLPNQEFELGFPEIKY